ncbi:Mitochondrial RNA-splicing protein MRS3 [Bienertia sinuspersici]
MATTDASPKFRSHELRTLSSPSSEELQQQQQQHQSITMDPSPSHEHTHNHHHDGLLFWQFMASGSIAGCAEHMAMFPVDTIKTRMQALGSCPIKSVGVWPALRSILKSDGTAGLYRGIAAMGLGAGPAHAVYFSVYEFCKKGLSGGNPNNHMAHAMSGVCATVLSDAVFTPMDMVKQRLQLSGGNGGTYRGVWDCVKMVFKEEGFKAFYASYRTTVVMNAPFTAVHFATYEAAKKGLTGISPNTADDERLVVHATAGAAAGALAAAITTPLDVVKTQLQCQGVCGCDRFTSGSIKDVFKTIIIKDGYRGLLRGWIPRMMFHAPAAAICWSTYEAAKTFFYDLNEPKK